MRIKITYTLITLLFFCVLKPAQAALDLELTQGVRAAIPIVIVPFVNNQSVLVPGEKTVVQIMKNDLQNSGQFRVKTPLLKPTPTNVSQINFQYWQRQRVNDVVVGAINSLGGGRYRVTMQLIAVYANTTKQAKTDPNQAVLLNESFTVHQTELRQLAHQLSDLIFQKLTGIRGIFSTKLAYVLVQHRLDKKTKYNLVVSDYDGFNPQTLLTSVQPIMSPAWSPDGKKIAYVSFEGHRAAIYLQDLATGQRQLISRYPGINGAPAFSPDGKKLAVVLTLTGNPKIYILNLRLKNLKQITHGYSIDTEPAWALDGKSLLFTSSRGGGPQIYRYMFSNGQVQRVTFDGSYNARASYLPNEQSIIMMHATSNFNGGMMFSIARQNLTTGQVAILTQAGADESPSIAPNGKMIIYATQYGGRGVLAMVSTDRKIKLRLPASDGKVQEPAWSPFLS